MNDASGTPFRASRLMIKFIEDLLKMNDTDVSRLMIKFIEDK